ncbi:MAG: GLPGLI family protein [Bacteroidota bacterium]|nr:GLPGLI family protein [Bacteroidota bacterium]
MKKIMLLILLQLSVNIIYSQINRWKVSGKIYYNTTHIRDTISSRTMNEVSILYFGAEGSLYRSYEAMQGLAAFQKWRESGYIGPNPGFGRGTRDLYYVNPNKKEVARVRDFFIGGDLLSKANYIMPEPMESFNWNITTQTKKIGDFICQMATGNCRGRLYTVWFCSDIPFSAGPWKLAGLPGLILEAEDSKKQVIFRFNRIEYPITEFIEPVPNAIIVKETDFEKMRQAYYDNPNPSGSNTGVKAIIKNAQGQEVISKRPTINNPIDLISKLPTLIF